ncbi:MAG: TrlF family AAA-like ATPase [Cetobacterium sp.]
MKNKGSEWRIWDLHFHTQSSYDYENKSVTNQEIINILSENNISVVAITDHHVIDIERIKDLQKLGLEKKITVLPGIEICSSTKGKEPLHFIGIFPEDCNLEMVSSLLMAKSGILEQQASGRNKNEIYCELKDVSDLIHQYGGIVTVHAGSKPSGLEDISNSLPQNMALKTDIAKYIDIFELGKKKDLAEYKKFVYPHLKKIYPSIICSDNHNIKKYSLKEKCWIKANPTFEGLKQILIEPEGRVFIGEKPKVLERYEINKANFIEKLILKKVSEADESKIEWFDDIEIEFNKELITIIGNKGKGKSAIADILGLIGNSKNYEKFNFLNENRFKKNNGKLSKMYDGYLYRGGEILSKKCLNDSVNSSDEELIKYIPQSFFEELTNEKDEKFEKELNAVIFSHLEEEKNIYNNFEDLKERKTKIILKEIDNLKIKLITKNEEIKKLEEKKHRSYLKEITNKLEEKNNQLRALTEPKVVESNSKNIEEIEISKLKKEIEDFQAEISGIVKQEVVETQKFEEIENFKKRIEIFFEEYEELKKEIQESNFMSDYQLDKIVEVKINYKIIEEELKKISENQKKLRENKLKLILEKEEKEEKNKALISELNGESKLYQEYLNSKRNYENAKAEIIGDTTKLNTIKYLEAEKKYIEEKLDSEIQTLKNERLDYVLEIFKNKEKEKALYQNIKKSIEKVMDNNNLNMLDSKLSLDVEYKIDNNFYDDFMSYINSTKKGNYRGKDDGKEYLMNNIVFNITKEEDLKEVLEVIEKSFDSDKELHTHDQIKDNKILDFYNYIYSLDYLKVSYSLKMDQKNLSELSPGEKGALLLIFYLLLDSSNIPLIMDQPEDNLDNQSVYDILVSHIKLAKAKRQIIMITHNPNLAVVADSEQIIYVDMDKKNNNKVSVISGAIEDKNIKEKIVEILEGTMPAFENRTSKYRL